MGLGEAERSRAGGCWRAVGVGRGTLRSLQARQADTRQGVGACRQPSPAPPSTTEGRGVGKQKQRPLPARKSRSRSSRGRESWRRSCAARAASRRRTQRRLSCPAACPRSAGRGWEGVSAGGWVWCGGCTGSRGSSLTARGHCQGASAARQPRPPACTAALHATLLAPCWASPHGAPGLHARPSILAPASRSSSPTGRGPS